MAGMRGTVQYGGTKRETMFCLSANKHVIKRGSGVQLFGIVLLALQRPIFDIVSQSREKLSPVSQICREGNVTRGHCRYTASNHETTWGTPKAWAKTKEGVLQY